MFSNLQISFPDAQLQPARVYKLTYRQKNYEHDWARVMFRDWDIDITRVRPASRMEITLDNKTFVGYVHDVKSHKDNNQNFTEVGFIGASYVMRQSSQQTFTNITVSAIAEKMAKKYGFAYKIEPHPRVYKQLSQAGLTDWEFLVRLAKHNGYFLRVEATSLYFQPLLQTFNEALTEAPVFSKVDAGFKSANLLYSFTPTIGETLSHDGADKSATSVAGIDAETGQRFKYTKPRRSPTTRQISQPELFDKHSTATVAPSYEAAKFEAEGIDENSKFPYIAEAEILGTTRIVLGGPIYLQNVGPKYDGYWTILEANHTVIEDGLNMYKYTTELVVGADSLGAGTAGKYSTNPPGRAIRAISPAVRGSRVKPTNIIKSPAIKVAGTKNVKLVERINRAAETGPRVSQATWASNTGSLVRRPQPPGRSAAATRKAVNYLGRR